MSGVFIDLPLSSGSGGTGPQGPPGPAGPQGPPGADGLTEAEVIAIVQGENVFANYRTQEVDEDGTTTYVGQVKTTGAWLLTKIVDTSGDLQITYANISNNATQTTFSLAWTSRGVLNYTLISSLTGV